MTLVHRVRLLALTLLIALASAGIGIRLYQLQLVGSERFRARAADQHQAEFTVQAARGSLLDRHGRELAVSVETQSLFAHPWKVGDPERAAALLAPVLGLRRGELVGKLRSGKPFVYLRRFLEPELAARVSALDLPLGPGQPFGFEVESKRIYPGGELGVHVIGYATIDGEGVEGVEKTLDSVLQGDPTVYLALKDARHGRLRQLIRAPERRSQDVVLTLDAVLQHIVERELDGAVSATGARAATAVLMDPVTGHVLALANRPAADANRYAQAGPAERLNRALVHYYEPGSTFKIVPMAAALELGTIRRDQRIHCENGVYTVGRRQIHDTSPHGWLTPRQIIAKSSNIGMVKVACSVSSAQLRETITRFGFGAKTGIELPGESRGLVRPLNEWSSFSQASLAFGQEIGVTPLQMVSALATIANEGVRVPPRVVLGTRDADGRLHPLERPRARRIVSREVAREIRSMLESVIEGGTGWRASVAGYRLAGKSGTAQKASPAGGYSDSEFMAAFGGFGPARQPRLVGLILLDSPDGDLHQGGQVAAPLFGRIMDRALGYLRVPGDRDREERVVTRRPGPFGGKAAAATPGVRPGRVPDVRGLGLREAISVLSAHGYRAHVRGTGVVTDQHPAPGAELASGGTCAVRSRPGGGRPTAKSRSRRSAG